MRVSPEIESLVPYAPGKPIEETKRELGLSEICKLASNENPLGPSPKAVTAIQSELMSLHRYPDPSNHDLRAHLSKTWNLPSEQILIGNGSNELIDLIIRVFCEPGDRILMPEKSFIAYGICAQSARVGKVEFPLKADLSTDVDVIIDYIQTKKTYRDKVLFLANPNNPTGTYLNKADLQKLLATCGNREDLLIVVDEAYNEFVRAEDYPETLDSLPATSNLMILRTFSKVYGLAGLRVGSLLASADLLKWIHRVRNPFNVNKLAQTAVIAAMTDEAYLKQSQQIVWDGLDYFYSELSRFGLKYTPSQGNFVLFETGRDAKKVFEACMKQGVLVRPVAEYKLPTHIRLSVGLQKENEWAMSALERALREVPAWM